jgi:hypothetical protein
MRVVFQRVEQRAHGDAGLDIDFARQSFVSPLRAPCAAAFQRRPMRRENWCVAGGTV